MKLLLGVFQSSLELIHTSAGINKLLLTGEERMALGANFNSHLAALCGLGCYCFAASATNYALFIIRMDSGLHFTKYLVSFIPMFFDIVRKHRLLYHIVSHFAIVF